MQIEVRKAPYAPFTTALTRAMCAKNRLEDAELHPAEHQFGVGADVVRLQVTSSIVSPIAKADIGGSSGEVALELQCAESCKSVAREADRIAVATHSAPTMEDDRTSVGTIQTHVIVEDMIEPKRLSEAFDVTACEVLLPV